MKKLLSFCLVLLLGLAIFGLTSCRNDDVELVFAWWGGDMRAEQTHEVIDMFVEQSDNVDYIEGLFTSFGDHWTDLSIRAAANDLPDIVQHDVAHLLSWVEAGHLVDLTPFINDNRIDMRNVSQAATNTGRVPGHPGIYAVPTGMNVAAMLYNATLLADLGLEAPRNMTIDHFILLSREIYERSGVRTNWAFNDPFNQMNVHLRAQGAALFSGGGLGGTIEQYEQFFNVLVQGIEEGWHILPEHEAGREGSEQNPMWYPPGDENANLRVWNSPVWSNMLNGYMNDAPDGMTIGMTTYPSVNPSLGNFGRATMFLTITTHSEQQDEAAAFLNFYMNTPAVHEVILGDRGVVVNTVVATAIAPYLPEGSVRQAEFVDWVNSPGNSSPYDPLRPAGHAELLEYLRLIIEDLTRLNITAREAAERFDAAGARIFS
ncbi:MAG: ABC transporter substrate-binding protein [Defluviitaleaceae bacterium]|nr:ABC transporter substrate-binding protein [Defluviitaleaceae bacterium]